MYSENLIKAVKEAFPDSPQIHKLADEGNVYLGRWLDDSSNDDISSETILLAKSLEELQAKARLIRQRQEVYNMWQKEDPRPKIG